MRRSTLCSALIAAPLFLAGAALALEPPFTQVREISGSILGGNSTCVGRIAVVDIDGDGDLDVFSGGAGGNTMSYPIHLHINKKKGKKWSSKIIQKDGDRNSSGWSLVDMDGDKDLDVVYAPSSGKERGLAYIENKGKGKAWVTRFLHKSKAEYGDVDAADMDGDGDVDIVTARLDKLYWLSNPGKDAEEDEEWELITPSSKGKMPGVVALKVADFDGDGDMDVVTASSAYFEPVQIIWHENQADGFKFVKHKLRQAKGHTPSILVTDINKDKKPDIIATTSAELALFENLGGGTLGQEVLLEVKSGEPGAGAVAVGDVDRDGDLDIFVNATYDMRRAPRTGLRWLENDDGDWEAHILGAEDWTGTLGIGAGDLDGDGDADLVLPHNKLRKVVWVVNRSKKKD